MAALFSSPLMIVICFLNASSGFRIGVNSQSVPVFSGVH